MVMANARQNTEKTLPYWKESKEKERRKQSLELEKKGTKNKVLLLFDNCTSFSEQPCINYFF